MTPTGIGDGTWGAWLTAARRRLADAGRTEPDALAEFTLADILNVRRTELVLHKTEKADEARRERADGSAADLPVGVTA